MNDPFSFFVGSDGIRKVASGPFAETRAGYKHAISHASSKGVHALHWRAAELSDVRPADPQHHNPRSELLDREVAVNPVISNFAGLHGATDTKACSTFPGMRKTHRRQSSR